MVENEVKQKNGIGTAGFILSIVAIVLCWVPVLNWILWFLGALFSIIGIFKKTKGLAIAGLIISFILLIIWITIMGAILASL